MSQFNDFDQGLSNLAKYKASRMTDFRDFPSYSENFLLAFFGI